MHNDTSICHRRLPNASQFVSQYTSQLSQIASQFMESAGMLVSLTISDPIRHLLTGVRSRKIPTARKT